MYSLSFGRCRGILRAGREEAYFSEQLFGLVFHRSLPAAAACSTSAAFLLCNRVDLTDCPIYFIDTPGLLVGRRRDFQRDSFQ